MILGIALWMSLWVGGAFAGESAQTVSYRPSFSSCDPVTELELSSHIGEPTPQFCAQWNPDFSSHRYQCCGPLPIRASHGKARGRGKACSKARVSQGFCSEMTQEQKDYTRAAEAGELGDILELIQKERVTKGQQAFCTVNNGFLAQGRRVIPSPQNRILIQSPGQCVSFGTDAMVGLLEWLGREVNQKFSEEKYSGVHLLLGDVSGPRGGCLFGRTGARRHASHTNGQDADLGFLTVRAGQPSPTLFHTRFDLETNWWFLKKVFQNPFACIKVVFLDRRHIHKLATFAHRDPDWKLYQRFIRHMPGHGNHFHFRVGHGPGPVGCVPNAQPELEFEDDAEGNEASELTILDELDRLKSRE